MFPSYESVRASPTCKWCSHFQFGLSVKGLCTLHLYLVAKCRHTCKSLSIVDALEYHCRVNMLRMNVKYHSRRYRYYNKETRNRLQRVYYQRHREQRLAYSYEWFLKNKDLCAIYSREWYIRNREQVLEDSKIRAIIRRYDPLFNIERRFKRARRNESRRQ